MKYYKYKLYLSDFDLIEKTNKKSTHIGAIITAIASSDGTGTRNPGFGYPISGFRVPIVPWRNGLKTF